MAYGSDAFGEISLGLITKIQYIYADKLRSICTLAIF
ncbi:MAG: hypothetical protein AMDU3_IPLC00004G0292 [Thermoplasmatales archaeon I-plasma]|jgi:hypothetical protein|nr:MAG: hypothetical protein AMDU3_IPLC00004G0292 [Thermoplasmatales archaeon I-plasma]